MYWLRCIVRSLKMKTLQRDIFFFRWSLRFFKSANHALLIAVHCIVWDIADKTADEHVTGSNMFVQLVLMKRDSTKSS